MGERPLDLPPRFAAAYEQLASRACPTVDVGASEPLGKYLHSSPLLLDGLISPDWSADRLEALLNLQESVQIQMSWHAAADARPGSNGSIVSPAARWLSLREGLRLLRKGSAARGYTAYLRQSDLAQQPGMRTLAPVSRVLQHAGSRLHKAGMWLGDASMISTLHHDEYHNILLLLAGSKRVLLLPPAAAPQLDLRVYDEERWQYDEARDALSDAPVKSMRRIDNFYHLDVFNDADVHDELAPRALLCELRAGEALYIPHPWAHAVLSQNEPASGFGLNLAVNVWWETAEAHWRHSLWKYGCTVIGLALMLGPQILGRLNARRDEDDEVALEDEPGGARAPPAAAARKGGGGKHSSKKGKAR